MIHGFLIQKNQNPKRIFVSGFSFWKWTRLRHELKAPVFYELYLRYLNCASCIGNSCCISNNSWWSLFMTTKLSIYSIITAGTDFPGSPNKASPWGSETCRSFYKHPHPAVVLCKSLKTASTKSFLTVCLVLLGICSCFLHISLFSAQKYFTNVTNIFLFFCANLHLWFSVK